MGTLGTFDSFTTARLGIYAAQHGLKVTGNNISNINTAGYTRQRIDQVSFKTGVYDRYRSMMDNHIGSGALVTGINQIRDPYLDIRYRTTSTDTSYYDTKLAGLEEIATILDEVGKGANKGDGLLYAQLQDLSKKLRAFSADPTTGNDTLARQSAEGLVSLFNNYADRLEQLRKATAEDFNKNVTQVNKILTNIRDLNKSIRECEINGDNALEMRDERNRQIDALAEYTSIKVQYSMEDVGAGIMVEKLTILMGNSNPDPSVETDSSTLVDGLYCTQLSVPEQRPMLNPYNNITDEDIANDPSLTEDHKNFLKGFLFVRETTDTNSIPDGVTAVEARNANGSLKSNAEGKQLYLVGTNDPTAEGIVTEPNDNYTVQLGKLLDVHGKEWESTDTTWTETTATPDGGKASYRYALNLGRNKFEDGDVITVGDVDYTVGTDAGLDADVANDAAALASFIAGKLTHADYNITSNGANIVFTAKDDKIGFVGSDGPADAPELKLENGDNKVILGARQTISEGADKDDTLPKGTTTDKNGTTTMIAYTEMNGKYFKVTAVTKHTTEVALDDNDLHGELQAQRELLTGEGEFASAKDVAIDENAAIERGIPYYQKSFDLLAQKFAEAYNELNTGYMLNQKGNYVDKDGNELLLEGVDGVKAPISKYNGLTADQEAFLNGKNMTVEQWLEASCTGYAVNKDGNYVDKEGTVLTLLGTPISQNTPLTADQQAVLDRRGETLEQYLTNYKPSDSAAVKMGGPLFSNRNDGDVTSGITAANISVSHSWSHGAVQLIPKFEVLFSGNVEHSTQNINADHMVSMIDKALTYNPRDLNGSDAIGPTLFKGSFNDMFSNLMGVQADAASVTNLKLTTSATTLVELDSAREGVSGVDLNDEAMNMIQYQKAYSAACRLMTAIDEALDRLINNTGLAGR